jgi:hypothetical protein
MSIRPAAQKAIARIDRSDPLSDDRWLTQTELAYKLGVSFRSITNWQAAKLIPYFRKDGVLRFDLTAVRKALERFIVKEEEAKP